MPRLNPEDFPEELREQVEAANSEYDAAAEAAARFAGIDADPAQVQTALNMYRSYTNANTAEQYRAEMARQWGILQEGQTLDDLRQLRQSVEEYPQHDPYAGYQDDPEALAAIQQLDQRYMSRSEVEKLREEMAQMVTSQREQAQMEADGMALANQERELMRRLQGEGIEVSDEAMRVTRAILKDRLMSDQVSGSNFHTAVEDSYTEYQSLVEAAAADMMRRQATAPKTTEPASATPGSTTPVTDIASATKVAGERLAAMRAAGAFDEIPE